MTARKLSEAELIALDALRWASLYLNRMEIDDDCEYVNSDEAAADADTARERIDAAIIALTGTFEGSAPARMRSRNRPASHEGRAICAPRRAKRAAPIAVPRQVQHPNRRRRTDAGETAHP